MPLKYHNIALARGAVTGGLQVSSSGDEVEVKRLWYLPRTNLCDVAKEDGHGVDLTVTHVL
jgi:hypothetical protein